MHRVGKVNGRCARFEAGGQVGKYNALVPTDNKTPQEIRPRPLRGLLDALNRKLAGRYCEMVKRAAPNKCNNQSPIPKIENNNTNSTI